MANSYVNAAFAIEVGQAEGDLLKQAFVAADLLEEHPTGAEREDAFVGLGAAFAAAFPSTEADEPFETFLELFDDPAYPTFGCDLAVEPTGRPGISEAYFAGEQVNVDAIAALLQRVALSALPCGFEYALTCDKLRTGEFGGGFVLVSETTIEHAGTGTLLGHALDRAQGDDGADGFVLAIRDPVHGLSFWNREAGFGRLSDATVFSETQAATIDKPIANDEPEWLAAPRPLAV